MSSQELGHTTAEKQKPSPLQFLADFRSAISLEKRLAKAGSKTNLKDLLGRVVADYNRLSLDSDLGAVMKAADPDFDWKRISFVLEEKKEEMEDVKEEQEMKDESSKEESGSEAEPIKACKDDGDVRDVRTDEDEASQRPAKRIKEASEVMQDSAGRWLPFRVSLETVFVLERKGLPEHVGKLDVIEQPTTFAQLLRALEDGGEEAEEEKPKKKKKGKRNSKGAKGKDITFKNFGAGLSISMFKQGSKLEIAWRARPVAVLSGSLAIGEQIVRLLEHSLPPRPTSSEESSPAVNEIDQKDQKPKKPRKGKNQSKKKTKNRCEEEEEDDDEAADAEHQHLDSDEDDDGDLDGLGDLLGQSLDTFTPISTLSQDLRRLGARLDFDAVEAEDHCMPKMFDTP
eukprot:s12_g16.t1